MKTERDWLRQAWRACVTVLLVVLASGAGLTGVSPRPAAPAESACVLPDTEGCISELTLHFVGYSEPDLAPTYRDLFRVLPSDVALKVLCPSAEDVEQFRLRWGPAASAAGRSVQVINVNQPITVWSRDRCIARETLPSHTPAGAVIPARIPEYDPEKCGELTVPQLLAAAGVIPRTQVIKLNLEGGNIVANERHAFVGANVYHENARLFEDECDIDEVLEQVLGRPYLIMSDYDDRVPWCHVDMYLTPVDDDTVLVASPTLALTLLTSELCGPESADDQEPSPEASEVLLTGGATLDSIAEQLEEWGYRVLRLPALLDPHEQWMITYNNVLMERRGAERIVYLPAYGFPPLDSAAASIYRALGFQVRLIDVSVIYKYGGSIRCLANVTARRDYAGSTSRSALCAPDRALAAQRSSAFSALVRSPLSAPDLATALTEAMVVGVGALREFILAPGTPGDGLDAALETTDAVPGAARVAAKPARRRVWRLPVSIRPRPEPARQPNIAPGSAG